MTIDITKDKDTTRSQEFYRVHRQTMWDICCDTRRAEEIIFVGALSRSLLGLEDW